eukprot:g32872.t1
MALGRRRKFDQLLILRRGLGFCADDVTPVFKSQHYLCYHAVKSRAQLVKEANGNETCVNQSLQCLLSFGDCTTLAMKMAKSVKTHTCFDLLGRNITFHSMAERNGKKWQRHCRATVAHNDAPCVHKCDLQKKANGWPSISSEELYKKLSDFFQLHRTFQGIRKLFHQAGQTEVICEISLDEGERRRAQSFNIHPALLDSIIQSGLGLICVSGGDFRGVPFHLGKFRLMKRRENFPCDLRTWCQGRSVDNGFYLNVQAFDMNGEIVCSVQDLFFKNIWALVPSPTVKLDLEWRKLWGDDLEAVSMNVDKQHWLVIWPGQEEFSELTLFEGIKQVVRATLVREFPLESAALKGITHTAVIAESQMTQDPMLYLDKAFHFIRFYQSCDGLGRSLSITLITQGGVALPDEEQDAMIAFINAPKELAVKINWPWDADEPPVRYNSFD